MLIFLPNFFSKCMALSFVIQTSFFPFLKIKKILLARSVVTLNDLITRSLGSLDFLIGLLNRIFLWISLERFLLDSGSNDIHIRNVKLLFQFLSHDPREFFQDFLSWINSNSSFHWTVLVHVDLKHGTRRTINGRIILY